MFGDGSTYFGYHPEDGDVVKMIMTSSLSCATNNPATSNEIVMVVSSELIPEVSITVNNNPACTNSMVEFTAIPFAGGSKSIL